MFPGVPMTAYLVTWSHLYHGGGGVYPSAPVYYDWSEWPPFMLIAHKDHNNTIQVYSVTVMTHAIALDAGQSSLGTFEPITPGMVHISITYTKCW